MAMAHLAILPGVEPGVDQPSTTVSIVASNVHILVSSVLTPRFVTSKMLLKSIPWVEPTKNIRSDYVSKKVMEHF